MSKHRPRSAQGENFSRPPGLATCYLFPGGEAPGHHQQPVWGCFRLLDARDGGLDRVDVGAHVLAVGGCARAWRPFTATITFLMAEARIFRDAVFQVAHPEILGTSHNYVSFGEAGGALDGNKIVVELCNW